VSQVQTVKASPVFNGAGTASTSAAWTTANITGGNTIYVYVGLYQGISTDTLGTISVTDSAGNIYTQRFLGKGAGSNTSAFAVYTAPITAGGGTKPTITVSQTLVASSNGSGVSFSAEERTDGFSSIDVSHTGTYASGATSFATGATAAAAASNEYLVSGVVDEGDNSGTFSVSASSPTITKQAALTQDGSGTFSFAVGTGLTSSGSACSATWSCSASDAGLAVILAIVFAGAGAALPPLALVTARPARLRRPPAPRRYDPPWVTSAGPTLAPSPFLLRGRKALPVPRKRALRFDYLAPTGAWVPPELIVAHRRPPTPRRALRFEAPIVTPVVVLWVPPAVTGARQKPRPPRRALRFDPPTITPPGAALWLPVLVVRRPPRPPRPRTGRTFTIVIVPAAPPPASGLSQELRLA
jgi:hypothetical protein